MQYKNILIAVAAMLTSTGLYAQQRTNITLPRQGRVIVKTDTIIVSKSVIKPVVKRATAAKVPAGVVANVPKALPATASAAAVAAAATTAEKYKPVPLAGASYYGEMNDFVTDFVRKYFVSHNRTLNVVKGRGDDNIFSLIDEVFDKHGIPKELKYLAVIESALNKNAVSGVGAVGPWQFMASTARFMGLKVNRKRDERRDYLKSTTAAAKYLNYLYSQLDDWLLVVAAYNSGPSPVQRAIKRTGSTNFWDIKKYLPRETQGHVMKFIATATIFENMGNFISTGTIPSDFNFTTGKLASEINNPTEKKGNASPFTPEELKNMVIIRISNPLSFELMAMELGIDKNLLRKWNPDYDDFVYNASRPEFYSLRIPKDKLDHFVDKKDYLTKRSEQIFSNQRM